MKKSKSLCPKCEGYGKLIEQPPIPTRYMPYGYKPKPFTCYICNGKGMIE